MTDRIFGDSERLDGSGRRRFRTASSLVGRPTRRRAGVFRRALRHEVTRLHDPRRLALAITLGLLGGFMLACLIARGEAAGADARAYWAAGRLWMTGGDPYHPTGPFMPYVYSPWLLPTFVPLWPVPEVSVTMADDESAFSRSSRFDEATGVVVVV